MFWRELHGPEQDDHRVRELWERLVTENPIDDLGASRFGWEAWRSGRASGSYQILVAFDHGEPVALTPLIERREGWRKLGLRVLASPGDDHWRSGHVLTTRRVTLGVEALLDGLVRKGSWDLLELGPVLTDSALSRALVEVGRSLDLWPLVYELGGAPGVSLDGSWEGYYRSRSPKLRRAVAQGERLLAAQGRVTLEEFRGGPDLEQRLEVFFQIEASGWKGTEGTAIAQDPRLRHFYRELARGAAERGALRLYFLRAGDQVVAADYCIQQGGALFVLKIGYHPAWAKCHPGYVLRKRVLEQLFASGEIRRYDLMAGGGEHGGHKLRWANCVRGYQQLRLFHPRSVRAQAARVLLGAKRSLEARRGQSGERASQTGG